MHLSLKHRSESNIPKSSLLFYMFIFYVYILNMHLKNAYLLTFKHLYTWIMVFWGFFKKNNNKKVKKQD